MSLVIQLMMQQFIHRKNGTICSSVLFAAASSLCITNLQVFIFLKLKKIPRNTNVSCEVLGCEIYVSYHARFNKVGISWYYKSYSEKQSVFRFANRLRGQKNPGLLYAEDTELTGNDMHSSHVKYVI